jgi:hypothetical protein
MFNTLEQSTLSLDQVGNDLSTAFDLGVLSGSLPIQELVEGDADPADVYRFTLNQASDFSLSLDVLSGGAEVALFDSSGQVLWDSSVSPNNGGPATPEFVSGTLTAGTYFATVLLSEGLDYVGQDANYMLTLSGSAPSGPIC